MTSGARETGKAMVRDSARAEGASQNTENKNAAETPNPKALLAADSTHPHPHRSSFNDTDTDNFLVLLLLFLCRVGNQSLRDEGTKTTELGFAGIEGLTSKLWQRFFIFCFFFFFLGSAEWSFCWWWWWWWPLCCLICVVGTEGVGPTWIFFGCGCAVLADPLCMRVRI